MQRRILCAQIVDSAWAGTGCYTDYPGNPGTEYVRYWLDYKFTRYKDTEACDGTVTTTIDSVWYESGYCWQESWFSSCSFPLVGTPVPPC